MRYVGLLLLLTTIASGLFFSCERILHPKIAAMIQPEYSLPEDEDENAL